MELSMSLAGTTFSPDKVKVKNQMVVSIQGRGGHGKSHWACGAPAPIAYMDLDFNSGPVREKFLNKGKEIWYAKYSIPSEARRKIPTFSTAAVRVWNQFQDDYFKALKEARTVVVDTASEAWELCRLAHFLPEWGRIEKIKAHHYTPLNSNFRNLLRAGYESDCNVILTHKVKKAYVGDGWNGKWERAGFGDIEFVCQVNLITMFEKGEFKIEIEKCTQNPGLVGQVLEGPMTSFGMIAKLVFPNSSVSDWK